LIQKWHQGITGTDTQNILRMLIYFRVQLTWSKSGGTEEGWTRSLMIPGAPLMKRSAAPGRASFASTTTPDLRVCELNSRVLTMVSLAVLESETWSGRRGKTMTSLSCSNNMSYKKSFQKLTHQGLSTGASGPAARDFDILTLLQDAKTQVKTSREV